jgi:hypothetical protein
MQTRATQPFTGERRMNDGKDFAGQDAPATIDDAIKLAVQLGYDLSINTRWWPDNSVSFTVCIARPGACDWLNGDDPVEARTGAGAILAAIEVARKVESHPPGMLFAA